MTEIRSIHGLHNDAARFYPHLAGEMPDRGKLVSAKAPYIPYTALTKGEFNLAILYDKATILAAAFPEIKVFGQAAGLYRNALQKGVSNGVSFVGALHDPVLQQAARNIATASRQMSPAAGAFIGRLSLGNGVHIGDDPANFTGDFDHDCVQYATKAANQYFHRSKDWTWWKNSPPGFGPAQVERNYWQMKKSECETKVAIEKILNDNMVNTSLHLVYKDLSSGFKPILGSQVLTKKILHAAGVGGLGNVAELSSVMMDNWVEAAIIRKNASIGAGPNGSIAASMALAPDPAGYVAQYNAYLAKNPAANPKYDKINGPAAIGSPIVVITAITALIAAIGNAIGKAAEMQKQLNSKKAGALAAVQGYGTPAFSAEQADFLTAGDSAGNNNILLIGGALAALYLLTE